MFLARKDHIRSFMEFKKAKTSNRTKLVKLKPKDRNDEVIIMIGMFQLKNEIQLKPVRGKRIAIRVKNNAGYGEVLTAAIEKWKSYCSDVYSKDELYTLCYDNGQEAILMPTEDEPFCLRKYKTETGKDYQRIVLYLCSNYDYSKSKEEVSGSYSPDM